MDTEADGGKPPGAAAGTLAAGALTSTTTLGASGTSAAVAAAASARAAAASAASAAAAASVSTDSARSWDSKRMSSSTSGLTRRSSSRVTSYKSAKAIRFPISGADSARSHLETAWRDSPSCSASPSWENPRSRRNSARRWAISTFITVPFRVLFVTSRLSPYGFNPSCTSTLCGQFTRTERKISDNHWLPHPRTGNLRFFQAASPRPLAPPSQRKSPTSSVTADTRADPRCGNPESERADRAMRLGRD